MFSEDLHRSRPGLDPRGDSEAPTGAETVLARSGSQFPGLSPGTPMSTPTIDSFDLSPDRVLARKYRVLEQLGAGYEGEVYRVAEVRTGIERAAKLFFPQRNPGLKTSRDYAKKLHKLRHCDILIQYQTEEQLTLRGHTITALISEYVDGPVLDDFLKTRPGRRLAPFEALHLLYALVVGMEPIHQAGEYHGDLHAGNIIVAGHGLEFELKLIDFFHWDAPKVENRRADVCDAIRLFYDVLGGRKTYARQSAAVKEICCGLKRTLILRKFPTMARLRKHLETMQW